MSPGSQRAGKGFTLVELMITLAVSAIALALAVPSWENAVQKRQVTSAAEQVASFLAYTQGQAIKSHQEITVTVTRNSAGTAWCVGSIDETAKAANALDHCECDVADGNTAQCAIDGQVARITHEGFEKFTMSGSQVGGSNNPDFNFKFDPVRGLKVKNGGINDGEVDGNTHEITLASSNGKWSLQVDVSVTGRVNICNPDSSKKVPGFDLCDG
jgi:type IV fimbrial biogenesis protein FimT